MINGFEEQTHDLTEYELEELLPLMVGGLSNKRGSANAVTNKQMIAKLRQRNGKNGAPLKVSDARIRKLINHIRKFNLIEGLVANSQGYYVSSDPVEIAKYMESLDARANEIKRVKDSLEGYWQRLLLQLNYQS